MDKNQIADLIEELDVILQGVLKIQPSLDIAEVGSFVNARTADRLRNLLAKLENEYDLLAGN